MTSWYHRWSAEEKATIKQKVSEVLRGILSTFHNSNVTDASHTWRVACVRHTVCTRVRSALTCHAPHCGSYGERAWLVASKMICCLRRLRGELSFSKGHDAGSIGTVNSHSANWFGTAHKGPECYRDPDLSVCTVECAVFRSGRTSTSKW